MRNKNVDISDPKFVPRLRTLRDASNLTKAELAERAGVSSRAVHDMEKGHRTRAQEKTLRLIAKALGVTFDELVTGASPPPHTTNTPEVAPQAPPAAPVRPRPRISGSATLALITVALAVVVFAVNIGRKQDEPGEDPISMAVTYFHNVAHPDDPESLGRVVADVVIAALSESDHLRVIAGHGIHDALLKQGYASDSDVNCAAASRAAQNVGAKRVLCGVVLQESPRLVISARVQDTDDGTVLTSQTVTAMENESVFHVAQRLAVVIRKDLQLSPGAGTEKGLPLAGVTTESVRAYSHYVEGMDNLRKLYRDLARQEFWLAVDADTTFAMAYIMLAHPDIAPDEPERRTLLDAARRHSQKITRRERLYLDAFSVWSAGGGADGILAVLETLVEQYPYESEAYRLLGRFYQDKHDTSRAVAALETAVINDPFDGRSLNSLAYLYASLGDFKKALNAVDRYVELSPDEANPYDTRGDILTRAGRLDEAVDAYKASLARNPTFFPSIQSLACICTLQGRYAEAERNFRLMLGMEDVGARVRARWLIAMMDVYRGRLQMALGKLEDGMVADRVDKHYGSAFIRKMTAAAGIYAQRGDTERALSTYEAAFDTVQATEPGVIDDWPINYLAMLSVVDLERAVAVRDSLKARIASRHGSLDHVAWGCEGWIDLARGDADAATSAFENAVGALDMFSLRYPLGLAYLQAGRTEDAIRTFERCLNGYASDRVADAIWAVKTYYQLGRAYERVERYKDAAAMYEQFLAIWADADPVFPEIDDARVRLTALAANI